MKIFHTPIYFSFLFLFSAGCAGRLYDGSQVIRNVRSIEDLDRAAVFSFAIMSDNKGDSSASKKEFSRMVSWMQASGDRFVIGLGDHVKKGRENDFIPFLRSNDWWRSNFYPNIADGENEYYGAGQGDWGAGGRFLNETGLTGRRNISLRKNHCEYYARIDIEGCTVHLIQLHFPDTPGEDRIAFPEESREYLVSTLESIDKGPRDIIIACAHSRWGSWLGSLSGNQRKLVMNTCDLILSATTHYFERIILPGYEHHGALVLNTGSITWPRGCPPGYVQVHVLENPLRIAAQYIRADRDERILERFGDYMWMKVIGGPVMQPRFKRQSEALNIQLP